MTEWMDGFFGDPNYEFEKPESLLRLEWVNHWDENEKDRTKLRLKGKLQLPAISRRLDLVFSGEETDNGTSTDTQGTVALSLNVSDQERSRVDATLGISSSDVTPGVRYRNQGPLGNAFFYRYTHRLEWEPDEGLYTTGLVNLDQILSENELLRWSNRLIYGEDTDGAEWLTNLSLRHRLTPEGSAQPFVISYYGAIRGNTDPDITRAYRLGVLMRRQIYRRFLFAEIEPSYNWRKKRDGVDREGGWKISLRFEIALQRDMRRARPKGRTPTNGSANTNMP